MMMNSTAVLDLFKRIGIEFKLAGEALQRGDAMSAGESLREAGVVMLEGLGDPSTPAGVVMLGALRLVDKLRVAVLRLPQAPAPK